MAGIDMMSEKEYKEKGLLEPCTMSSNNAAQMRCKCGVKYIDDAKN
jgi:hypothetical protein